MSDSFAGKTAMVAGGTGGLGLAVSLAFLREGAEVVVTYRNAAEYAALQKAAGEAAARLTGVAVDVTDEVQVRSTIASLPRIDMLVNAVGGYAGGLPLWETDLATFSRMLDLNLRAGFVLLRAIVPVMLRQKSGAIVNIASRAAVDHAAGATAYAVSKTAAVAMIDCLAADLKGTGVRANSVLPSIIDTEANRRAMPDSDFAQWPKPEEIAEVVLYLCSDAAGLVHGASIPVYGNR